MYMYAIMIWISGFNIFIIMILLMWFALYWEFENCELVNRIIYVKEQIVKDVNTKFYTSCKSFGHSLKPMK